MSALPVTIFFSLLLAGLFAYLFAREQSRRGFAGAERDSLLPLSDEMPRPADTTPAPLVPSGHPHDADHDDHDHDHADGNCGCRNGARPPCHGCLKRFAPATKVTTSTAAL